MLTTEQACPECGSRLTLDARAGRLRRYRGEDGYEIPADMVIPTCTNCGALWLDSTMVTQLSSAFELIRAARRTRGEYQDASAIGEGAASQPKLGRMQRTLEKYRAAQLITMGELIARVRGE
jgi:hypothetical protein